MSARDFKGQDAKEPMPEERPILRWYQIFKYPEGVLLEEGDAWYLRVHAEETKHRPGLLRFVSHRVIENPPFPTPWQRVSELWYGDVPGWHEAIGRTAPQFTPPRWSRTPPFVDMVSTFVGYKPDVDFLRDNLTIP